MHRARSPPNSVPGDLRENIMVDCDDLYDLPSGTVVKIGQALLRLTFHCEPCRKILKLIDFDRIEQRRRRGAVLSLQSFREHCVSLHTYGHGRRTPPALKRPRFRHINGGPVSEDRTRDKET